MKLTFQELQTLENTSKKDRESAILFIQSKKSPTEFLQKSKDEKKYKELNDIDSQINDLKSRAALLKKELTNDNDDVLNVSQNDQKTGYNKDKDEYTYKVHKRLNLKVWYGDGVYYELNKKNKHHSLKKDISTILEAIDARKEVYIVRGNPKSQKPSLKKFIVDGVDYPLRK